MTPLCLKSIIVTIGTLSIGKIVNSWHALYIVCVEQVDNSFGRWLKTLRQSHIRDNGDTGLTAEEFGAMIGISHAYVSRLERGERHPSATLIDTIALKFNVDTNFLRELAQLPLVDKTRKESPIVSQIIKVLASMSPEKQEMALNLIQAFSNDKPPNPSSNRRHRKGKDIAQ